VSSECTPCSCEETTLSRGEIHIAGNRRQCDLMLIRNDDELFELSGLPVQAAVRIYGQYSGIR
jgi:hypothetical protein